MTEEWKAIAGWEGLYEVSNLGRVRSLDRVVMCQNRYGGLRPRRYTGQLLKLTKGSHGYYSVMLSSPDRVIRTTVHRLVAEAFLPKPFPEAVVDHSTSNLEDNSVNEIRWVCVADNNRNRHKAMGVSGLVGVCYRPRNKVNQYEGYATAKGGRHVFLGRFATAQEAHEAWKSYSAEQYSL